MALLKWLNRTHINTLLHTQTRRKRPLSHQHPRGAFAHRSLCLSSTVFISLLTQYYRTSQPSVFTYYKDKEGYAKTHQQPTLTRLNLSSSHNKSVYKYLRVSTAVSPHKITDLNLLNYHLRWPKRTVLSLPPGGQGRNCIKNKRTVMSQHTQLAMIFVHLVVKIHEAALCKI